MIILLDSSSQKRPSFSPSSSVNYVTQNHGENFSETQQIPQLPITTEQRQRLLEFLQTNPHQASANQVGSLPKTQNHIFSKMSSNIFTLNVKHSVFHSNNLNLPKFKPNPTNTHWIIDTEAIDHMVSFIFLLGPLSSYPFGLDLVAQGKELQVGM
jgi:hypothetical protein